MFESHKPAVKEFLKKNLLSVATFLRIYRALSSQMQWRVIRIFLLMIMVGVMEFMSIVTITLFAMTLNAPDTLRAIPWVNQILATLLPFRQVLHDDGNLILATCALAVMSVAVKNGMWIVTNWKMLLLSEDIAGYIGKESMHRFLHMPYTWHLSAQGMDAYTRISWRQMLAQFTLSNLAVFSNFITSTLLFTGLMFLAPVPMFIVLIFFAGASALLCAVLNAKVSETGKEVAKYSAAESCAVMNAVKGIREVLIYQQQNVFLDALNDAIRKLAPNRAFVSLSSSIPSFTLEICGFFLIMLVATVLIKVQHAGAVMVVSTVSLFMLTAWRILPAINRMVGAIVAARGSQAMALQCLEFFLQLNKPSEETQSSGCQDVRMQKTIELKNVSFTYPQARIEILHGLNITIPKGGSIGIFGLSGVGKSTLLNVLSGLTPPTGGEIRIDGQLLDPVQHKLYRRRIGYVSQKPYIMAGTIAENVAFSQWGKPYDPQRVKEACRKAAIDFLGVNCEDITRMVGEGGVGLSGGEAQRVSIARALYADPDIIVFDEATSALDHVSEALIFKTIQDLRHSITCVVATHRLNTLEACDVVYWLEGGEVVASGTPQEILPRYRTGHSEKISRG